MWYILSIFFLSGNSICVDQSLKKEWNKQSTEHRDRLDVLTYGLHQWERNVQFSLWSVHSSLSFKIIRCKKILQIQKGLLSRGATGWMLHFNVRNTNWLLNMYQRTCCWEGNWCCVHWNEASSLLHRASKVLFESAWFLYLIICTLFCSVHLFGKAMLQVCLRSKLLGQQFENETWRKGVNGTQMPATTSRDPSAAHGLECHFLSRTWALLLIPRKTQASQK